MTTKLQVLVCYDVATTTPEGRRRLRRMSKTCSSYGQRVQYSTFELSIAPALMESFLRRARNVMDVTEDSLRVYTLRGPREEVIKVYGRDGWTDFDAPLVV